nr:unnamed protein product [Digitaria exilis]
MSGAIGLKSMILDGCVLLEHVGPEGLPPLLESFSFDAGSDPSKISKISLAGCVHLKSFLLHGAFPGLEELDLSGTSVKTVDLSSKVVQVNGLNKVILIGCKQLRALLWSKQLKVLRIDTNERNEQTQQPCSDLTLSSQEKNYDSYVIASETRIIQSLWHWDRADPYLISNSLYLHLHNAPPSTRISERRSTRSDKDIIPKPCCYNKDVSLEGISSNDGGEILWPPPSDCHVEINLPSLEALHITHCGHLRHVFPWDDVHKPRPTVHRGQAAAGAAVNKFPNLKHIHLHELPSLQEICEDIRMLAPVLESVELRGCWALRRLPAVGRRSDGGPAAVVRIERDCWEKLEWDGRDVGHHPSLYEPRFSSRYYRKEHLLRGTVLR